MKKCRATAAVEVAARRAVKDAALAVAMVLRRFSGDGDGERQEDNREEKGCRLHITYGNSHLVRL